MRFFFLKEPIAKILFAVLLVGAIALAAIKSPFDPDLFWHIRAGQEIMDRGIPFVDWFSHTFSNFKWVDHEYTQDVLMALLHQLGGFRLIAIFYTLVITATFTIGLKWALPKKITWPWVLVAGLCIVILSNSFIGSRPQMFTYLFLLLVLGTIQRLRENQKTKIVWFLPLLFVLWANFHASFLIGLIVIYAVIVAETIKYFWGNKFNLGERWQAKHIARLSLVALLCFAATFINPYTYGVWVETIRTLTDRDLHNNIVEWFAPQVFSKNGYLLFASLAFLFFVLTLRQKRNDITQIVLILAFFIAALSSVRNIPLFLILCIPTFWLVVREFFPKSLFYIVYFWPSLLIITLLLVICARFIPYKNVWQINTNHSLFEQSKYPVKAAEFLRDHPEYSDYKAYNNYGWGGYLLYQIPGFKTFIDGRMPSWSMDGVKIIDDYFIIDRHKKDWQETADKYQVNMYIINADHKLVAVLKNNKSYKEIFRDNIAVIFIKKS